MSRKAQIDWSDPNATEKITFHVGARVLSDRQAPAVKGCYKERCNRCDRELWVSPGSLKNSRQVGYEVAFLCVDCFRDVLPKFDGADIILPVPADDDPLRRQKGGSDGNQSRPQ